MTHSVAGAEARRPTMTTAAAVSGRSMQSRLEIQRVGVAILPQQRGVVGAARRGHQGGGRGRKASSHVRTSGAEPGEAASIGRLHDRNGVGRA
jgi:hypothetical protein